MSKMINKHIRLDEVKVSTVDLLNYSTGDEYESDFITVPLLNNHNLETYNVLVAYKKGNYKSVYKEVIKNSYFEINNFNVNDDICCIISIFASDISKFSEISFDKDEIYPVKTYFTERYKYIERFFNSFINFRNDLIMSGDIIKEDDLYQFFCAYTNSFQKSNNKIIKKIIKKRWERL